MSLHLDNRQRAMLKEMGVTVWLPGTDFAVAAAPASADSPGSRTPPMAQAPAPVRTPVPAAAPVPPVAPVAPVAAPAAFSPALAGDWPALVEQVAQCQACPQHAGRSRCAMQAPAHPVQADWLVVLDPPEEEQERQQQPVTGDAAVLLDNMLKAVGVSRSAEGARGAYVTTVTKCRVPHAILPTADDLQQCRVHLRAEIALVKPRMVLLMGRFAQQLVAQPGATTASMALDHLRGQVHRFEGLPTVVTYPPTILLRNSAAKAKAWADLCLALDTLEAA
ncbi:uracil-DNA glycosylase [Curvibacter sp. APW13]|uniref:uracil-DNA glycosylase n=1 Tax=Curvibacter sp. APW13 TaxID=3077236 RepID=UPI0028DFB14A|nr:uracil-DNA glycosylase [Curvibacter sp. APW13]MDT8990076.1 uracil-DNA glycosylase [Curvibacter sp. APW13]